MAATGPPARPRRHRRTTGPSAPRAEAGDAGLDPPADGPPAGDVCGGPPGSARLAANTAFLLSRVGFEGAKRFEAALGPLNLRPKHFKALHLLEGQGPCSQQSLGELGGIDPSNVVAIVDDLEAAGLATRRRNPGDRRAYALQLTPAGVELLARAHEAAEAVQAEVLRPLAPAERRELHGLLTRLESALRSGG